MKYFYYIIIDILIILFILDIIPIVTYTKISDNQAILKINDFEVIFTLPENNEYYLNHDIYGNYDMKGSVFVDYRTNLNSKILIIYGHNSPTLSVPFKYLENYYNEDFYHKHRIIEIYNNDIYNKYEIYSVFIATDDFFYMNLNMNYQNYLNTTKKYSWYDDNIDINIKDDIIVLQTCSYHSDYQNYLNKYLIIIGKKIK